MQVSCEKFSPSHGAPLKNSLRAHVNYPAIDVLRGIAATMVMVFHVIVLGKWESFPNSAFGDIFRNGWVGVDLFFVISGFVITLATLRGYSNHGPAFRQAFMKHRLARIVPLYFLSGLVFLFCTKPELLAEPTSQVIPRLAAFLLFVQNLHPLWHGAINGPSWSVALEMQFYALMLCLAPWLTQARAIPLVVKALILAAAYRFATTLALVPGDAQVSEQFVYLSQLPGVIDEFALGALMALGVNRNEGRLRRALLPSWNNFLGWAVLACALLSMAATLFSQFGYWENWMMLVMWRPLLSAGLFALVACVVAFPIPCVWWLAPARYAGRVSYGLYLWHFPVLVALTLRVPRISGFELLLWTVTATWTLSIFSWHLIEKPYIERVRRQSQFIGIQQ